jgi:hypothetical protein
VAWGFDDDVDERTLREAANGIRQTRRVSQLVRDHLAGPVAFKLTSELLCELNELGMHGLIERPGELPGELPVPARLKHAPIRYRRALEAADAAWAAGQLDLREMEQLLEYYLGAQLRGDPAGLPP